MVSSDTGWESDPRWMSTVGLGKTESMPATERFPDDPDWVRRWTVYADCLRFLQHVGDLASGRVPIPSEVLAEVGSPARVLYGELDVERLGSGVELGRALTLKVFLPTIERLCFDEDTDDDERPAIAAWYFWIQRATPTGASRGWHEFVLPAKAVHVRTLAGRLWDRGLWAPRDFPKIAAPGLRRLTRALDLALTPYTRGPGAGSGVGVGVGKLIDRRMESVLPERILDRLCERAEGLKRVRAEQERKGLDVGIDERGRTELLADAVPQLVERISRRESMLVLGPTSSGKSDVGRLAVCFALLRTGAGGGRAILLLPTKALVTQAHAEWETFKKGTPLEGWRVLPGSRDYPQNDDAIRSGRFEIAILIPEKLGSLMSHGMNLRGISLLLVDELQHLADEQRGARLETLLTRVKRDHPSLPIIGLSATLTAPSADNIGRWLGIAPEAIVRAGRRPVPLDLTVCDDRRARTLHAEGWTGDDPEPPDLRGLTEAWSTDRRLREVLSAVPYYKRGLALCVHLLRSGIARQAPGNQPGPRGILCFVGSRDQAEQLAKATRTLIERDINLPPVLASNDPFDGRFKVDDATDEKSAEARQSFRRFPDTRDRRAVEDALRTGVGFHSGRLEHSLRETVEDGFRSGRIRLLFATDTLKLGLNLPADVVVLGSLTTPAGRRRQRVLDHDAAAQRLGRAGRLGFSERGRGYLVVPEEPPRANGLLIGPDDRAGLAGLASPGADDTEEPEEARARRALCEVDAVFGHYVVRYRDPVAAISSQLDDRGFARLLLNAMTRDSPSPSVEELRAVLSDLHRVSFAAFDGKDAPSIDAVLSILREHELVGQSHLDPDRVVVTGLGRAVSTSELPFEDAVIVEEIGKAASAGAGILPMVWSAVQSTHVRASMDWIALNPIETDEAADSALRRQLIAFAEVFVCEPNARAAASVSLAESDFVAHLPALDLVGRGLLAQEFRRMVGLVDMVPSPGQLDALLRACVLTLWMHGCPLEVIRRAVVDNVRVHYMERGEQRRREIPIHATDVRNLGENCSYLFAATAEFMGIRPEDESFRLLEAASVELQLGLPAQLEPLARLNKKFAHRERIVRLVSAVSGRIDDVSDLVDQLLALPEKAPANRELRAQYRAINLTATERQEVRALIAAEDERRSTHSRSVAEEDATTLLPGRGGTLKQWADDLGWPERAGLVEEYLLVFRALGCEAEKDGDGMIGLATSSTRRPRRVSRVQVVTQQVTAAYYGLLRHGADLIVAVGGVSPGLVSSCRDGRDTERAVVIEPATLFEVAGRVLLAHGLVTSERDDPITIDPDGHDDEFLAEWPSEEQDAEDLARGADLGVGYEACGADLHSILLAAPPLLGRRDVHRLVAGLSVAAPPNYAPLTDADRQVP